MPGCLSFSEKRDHRMHMERSSNSGKYIGQEVTIGDLLPTFILSVARTEMSWNGGPVIRPLSLKRQ